MYLTTCYNPEKAEVFPKQKTIAAKIGVSERSVVRAVQELFKVGLILIECKHTNRYKIVANSGVLARDIEKKLSLTSCLIIPEKITYKNPPHCCEGLVTI